MSRFSNWKLAKKLQASNKKGLITGLIIAILVITLVVVVIMKLQWIKKQFGCLECDELDDDFDLDFEEDGVFATE